MFKCATLSGSAASSSSFFCGGGRHVEKLLRGRGLLCLLSIVGALSEWTTASLASRASHVLSEKRAPPILEYMMYLLPKTLHVRNYLM